MNKETSNVHPLTGFASMLYQEAKASAIGLKQIAKTLGKARAAKSALKLFPAFSTYLLTATVSAVGLKWALDSNE